MKNLQLSLFVILALLIGAAELLPLWWYREPAGSESSQPTLSWKVPAGAIDLQLSQTRAAESLNYDRGIQVLLKDEGSDIQTEVTYLEYEKGNDRILEDLYLHSPEVCLPAAGGQLVQEYPSRNFPVRGGELSVRHWLFKHPVTEEPLHVFKTIWTSDEELLKGLSQSRDLRGTRLKAIAARRKLPSGKMLLAVVHGLSTEKASWKYWQENILSKFTVADSQKRKEVE